MTAVLAVDQLVAAPAEQVWRLLADWDGQSEWMPLTVVYSTDGQRVGGRIEAWTGIGRLGFWDTMIITGLEPPRRAEVLHTGRVVRGLGVFAVEPLGPDRSRVVWEAHLELPLGRLGRLGWPMVRPFARAGLRLALRRFAARAVSARGRPAAASPGTRAPRPGGPRSRQ